MIVYCEDCGKKHDINVEEMRTDQTEFRCRACDYINTVTKPSSKELKQIQDELSI